MKVVAISDTHGQRFDNLIPKCDILIHAGDICPMHDHGFYFQQQWVLNTFIPSLKYVPAKHIVFIGGNHDFYLDEIRISKAEQVLRSHLPSNVHYLRDSYCDIKGIRIYGTPTVINLPFWAFNCNDEDDKIRHIYSNIPMNVDILVSHGPAYGYSDTIKEYNSLENLGSKSLLAEIKVKKPRYVISGHIHSAEHDFQTLLLEENDISKCTDFFCASLLDEKYEMKYRPKVFEIAHSRPAGPLHGASMNNIII